MCSDLYCNRIALAAVPRRGRSERTVRRLLKESRVAVVKREAGLCVFTAARAKRVSWTVQCGMTPGFWA